MRTLISGERYWFPLTIPCDGRLINGLFTGQYDRYGNAAIISQEEENVYYGWFISPKILFDEEHKNYALLV